VKHPTLSVSAFCIDYTTGTERPLWYILSIGGAKAACGYGTIPSFAEETVAFSVPFPIAL
jgi:hypothetical protein